MWSAAVCLAVALLVVPVGAGSLPRLRRGESPAPSVPRSPVADPHAVATMFDMMAACLRGGLPTGTSALAVSTTAPPGAAAALRTTADLLSLGADPEASWAPVAALPEIEPLARMARRSAKSGASLADAVTELAQAERARAEDAAAAAAGRAGVLISSPLGLCFLPAFVCLGIVSVVIGLARNVLGGGLL